MLFSEQCQSQNLLADPPLGRRLVLGLFHALPVRTTIRRALKGRPPPQPRMGAPSRFAPGEWVRVRDAPEVRATLDRRRALRGLVFVEQQWPYCGGVYRVLTRVQRLLDDRGNLRPVARTVTLEGTSCGGTDGTRGCGRDCPLMFRDEWLEPAAAPALDATGATRFAVVRGRREIAATLDGRGRTDGLVFMPEMFQFCGARFPVRRRVTRAFELDHAVAVETPVYILDGLYCGGLVLGAAGPCDRACRLLWHHRWLELDPLDA